MTLQSWKPVDVDFLGGWMIIVVNQAYKDIYEEEKGRVLHNQVLIHGIESEQHPHLYDDWEPHNSHLCTWL